MNLIKKHLFLFTAPFAYAIGGFIVSSKPETIITVTLLLYLGTLNGYYNGYKNGKNDNDV